MCERTGWLFGVCFASHLFVFAGRLGGGCFLGFGVFFGVLFFFI